MQKPFYYSLAVLLAVGLFSACSTTRSLQKNEYLLTQNVVKMTDVKSQRFDDLFYLIRPETNTKFLQIFNIKTSLYGQYQEFKRKNTDSVLLDYPINNFFYGAIKQDMPWHLLQYYRFRQWLGEKVGEKPVLLDSTQIGGSIDQIKIAMQKMGYFNAEVQPEVIFRKVNKKKAKVVYHVTANDAYYIRKVNYHISIPEYRRIILADTVNCLIKTNQLYDENTLSQERTRILTSIRDHGYYYVPSTIITMEVDTLSASQIRDNKGRKTVAIDVLVNFDAVKDKESVYRAKFQYEFDDVYVYTNLDPAVGRDIQMDTVLYRSMRNKNDSTHYYFITPHSAQLKSGKLFRDYKYRTIVDVIFTKKNNIYAKSDVTRSYQRLNALNNFSIINIELIHQTEQSDSTTKTGYLDSRYQLARRKVHGISLELSARTDKSNLSFTYTNKNIFKGAEYFTANVYGSVYYYDWINNREMKNIFGEIGGSLKLEFPHLFLFKQTQRIGAQRYSTSIEVGANYSWYYFRLMLNTALTYNWSPNAVWTHTLSPINISTIATSVNTENMIREYPSSYKDKFQKRLIASMKYGFSYDMPTLKFKHKLNLAFHYESSGLLLSGINALSNAVENNKRLLTVADYPYATYEMAEFTLHYTYTIDKNNSVATRMNIGLALPLFNSKDIPFEKSFYLGGANSMRAWGFRALGPGSYHTENYMQRTGDVKLEMNLEYRGTIYKAIKFGIFADM
ncbi:MAG: BamA/TamA family outer membrane protein, partial [Bacteroidales bacterium]|nr:BamA/TamA family outer membrane protein [Bacteroidales bacterium]